MAQYHKIPQNVTTYEGRIVGKFTAKQFIFLAIGGILIFLIVNTQLPKNVIIVVSVVIALISMFLALANFEGKTIDMWVTAFVKVVYKPTQR